MRSISDSYGGCGGLGSNGLLVEQLIGTSYDVVKFVAENLQFIKDGLNRPAYFPTIQEGLLNLAVGFYFTSDDKTSVTSHPNKLRLYKRIAQIPFFEDQGDSAAPASTEDINDLNTLIEAVQEIVDTEFGNLDQQVTAILGRLSDAEILLAGKITASVLAGADGASFVGITPALGAPVTNLLNIFKSGPVVAAHLLRRPSDPDDTLAVRRAIDSGFPVYLQSGKGSGTAAGQVGDWLLKQQDATGATSLINKSNIKLMGDGRSLTRVRGTTDSYWVLHSAKNTPDAGNNYRDITIEDIGFYGNVESGGFAEHTHIVSLSAVSNVLIQRCAFVGFQGDGVYIGQGNTGGQEVHNERVTIRDCYFDGVTNNNRNGVSFIDCTTSLIENTTFVRVSRPGQAGWDYPRDGAGNINFPAYYAELEANKLNSNWGPGMPGPIDYEPDGNNARIIDAKVRGCIFWGCSGNVGTLSLQIPATVPKGNVRGIIWEGNIFRQNFQRGYEACVHVVRNLAEPVGSADTPNQIIIRNNIGWGGYNGQACIAVYSAKGVLVEGNMFTDYVGACLWGYVADSRSMKVFGVRVKDNTFTRCANGTGNGIMNSIFDAEQLIFDGNVYDDCGDGSGFSYTFDFNVGSSRRVDILNNTITGTKSSNNAIIKEAGHTYEQSSNRLLGNNFGGRNAFFNATHSDLPQTYVPVLEGGGTPGVATYTGQFGEFTQIGSWVQGYARVSVSAHTGVGIMEIGVPVNPADLSGPEHPCEVIITSSGAGVPGAGKQLVAQVHGFASTPNGEGAIRVSVYDPATGLLAPYNIQNVGYTIYVRFAYRAQVGS